MSDVSKADIVRGLRELQVRPPLVAVHSSLRSFGRVQGGAETVIAALLECFETVMMPGFQYAASVPPPMNPPPRQNGCDYQVHFDLVNPPKPFRVDEVPIRPSIGVIARVFAQRPDVRRSHHPHHSWTAWGKHADELTRDHPWTTTNAPLERLEKLGGSVLLMGVTLASCTAIHTAEERAGRPPFIRWAMDEQRAIREVRTAGCGKGFGNLAPLCRGVFHETQIGSAEVMTAPLKALIDHVVPILRARPEITVCSDTCLRCQDALRGGPILPT
jgi:aminoglycoside 3-N-acetyltransferase